MFSFAGSYNFIGIHLRGNKNVCTKFHTESQWFSSQCLYLLLGTEASLCPVGGGSTKLHGKMLSYTLSSLYIYTTALILMLCVDSLMRTGTG